MKSLSDTVVLSRNRLSMHFGFILYKLDYFYGEIWHRDSSKAAPVGNISMNC